MADGIERGQDIEPLPSCRGGYEQPSKTPQHSQKRGQNEMRRIDEIHHPLARLGFL